MTFKVSLPVALLPLALGLLFLISLAFDAQAERAYESAWIALTVLEAMLAAFTGFLVFFRISVNGQAIEVRGGARRRYDLAKVKRISVLAQRYGKIALIDFEDGDQLKIGGWIGRFDDLVKQIQAASGQSAEFERVPL
jgi:multidrug efflux pump subunit AcrA (membrane-fusion protein)